MNQFKQWQKKLFTLLLAVCMLIAPPCTILQAAAEKPSACYVAFGDSIAAGYGLAGYSSGQGSAPADSYQALLADFLHTTSRNYAVTGDDSSRCMELLASGAADSDLSHADIITLSIGSNDLLLPFLQIVMDYYQIDPADIDGSMFADGIQMPQIGQAELVKYYQQSEALIADLKNNATLHTQAAAFEEKLQTIISTLRQKAPGAEIYVTNIYNPFHSIPLLGEMAETYISEINQAFSVDHPEYTLVDVHTPFNQKELTNIHLNLSDLSNISIDPHPSVEGHKVIANSLVDALKKAHTPKAASILSISSSSKYKLAVKLQYGKDADGCEIQFAASKKGSYQTLASSSKKTFRSNSGKLKKGKTYYFKVRSFNNKNGVTYYGKLSKAKAFKIK